MNSNSEFQKVDGGSRSKIVFPILAFGAGTMVGCVLSGGMPQFLQSNQVNADASVSLAAAEWDCSNSMYPSNLSTCWGDQAYQQCGYLGQQGGQWAYDAMMKVGGNGKEAYELLNILKDGDCASCDVSKAGCSNSMYPSNLSTCWGDSAYQRCPNARQPAYDAVMKSGGRTVQAYCHFQALIKTECSSLDEPLDAWDCSNSMNPSNLSTCWADTAFQQCAGGQWAYDAVMKVGGSSKEAYELLNVLKDEDCASCDVSKAGCANSMNPSNLSTCWGDTAYQRCPNGRQPAYDAVMKSGGSTPQAYCKFQALLKNNC